MMNKENRKNKYHQTIFLAFFLIPRIIVELTAESKYLYIIPLQSQNSLL